MFIWVMKNIIYLKMQLDDTIIKTIETTPNQELKEARELILRIRRRKLYQACLNLLFYCDYWLHAAIT